MAKKDLNNAVNAEKKKDALSREEAGKVVTYRVLIILLADIIMGTLLDFIHFDSHRETTFVFELCPILIWVFGAMTVAALAYLIWSVVKKVDTRRYPMTPFMIFALCLFLFAVTLLYKSLTPVMIISVMIIASVLFVLYYIYTNLLY
ncbi:MAG: hypothetical protein IJ325_07580 [Clostridia bacterium]|nr:hypothetical protein [Clostridia bacterium]